MRAVSRSLNIFVEKFLPNAFLFALILTLITVALGMMLGGQSLPDMANHWYGGFWAFLEFGMQMVVVLVTGYALAKAPLVNRLLSHFASIPKTQLAALVMTMVVAAVMGFVSWGLGFVGGTLVAIEIARRVRAADFRLLVAAAYAAVIATQPVSLALTAPLLVNTPGHSLEEQIGLIPVTETLFSPTMISAALFGFLGVLITFILMAPKMEDVVAFTGSDADDSRASDVTVGQPAPASLALAAEETGNTVATEKTTVSERINNSRIINYLIVIVGLVGIILYFAAQGFNLELNIINFVFLIVGMALHGSPAKYAKCITDGIPAASGIVLQFPFYAGIIGMMGGAGLIVMIGELFGSLATEATFPFFAFVAAMIVNVFVPSAGGQWQVQGPVMLEATGGMDISPATVVNAISVGDMTTNLLQPFFVLPALGLSGLGLKDIWGYCMTAMVVLFLICGTIFLLVPVLGW
ncbi:short-chain fatty acid transporter [Brevibacterium jeotgali]|uniref:Short-chain fatty acids transporter n=1 Tax=Brevibacterium jeotgali TaxID=1262550 RepID=A0A2H1L2L7_9MICO|nr:TIGR00366 family protein [Brevibacterium jeotgali]TWC02360.1 short-chain fatty acids transporter [Brevibacterium jeotgali]SMY11154.1 short-chain fatty acids transporter [Brevibacterium jeotgali]